MGAWSKILLALVAATGATAPANADQCDGRPCIHVGAFNIKLLGNNGPANSAAEYHEIGRLLDATMDLDVVVLEEINVRSNEWRGLREELERRGYAIAFESAFGGELDQFIVVAHRTASVQLAGTAPRDLPFPTRYSEPGTRCDYENLRPPIEAAFRAGAFDFRVIGVHLKSQRPVGSDGRCDDLIRTDQARRIALRIGEIAADEADVIMLGDFNSVFPGAENEPFQQADFRSAMEDRAPGSGTISYVSSPRSLIDMSCCAPRTKAT